MKRIYQIFVSVVFILYFSININAQLVVTDPGTLQALERQNAVQLKDFQESIKNGMTLTQIQGLQKEMLDLYNKSSNYIQNATLFYRISQKLYDLGKELKDFKAYEENYSSSQINLRQIQNLASTYYSIQDLLSMLTDEGLTPGDRIQMLNTIETSINRVIEIILEIKAIVINTIKNKAQGIEYQKGILKTPGFSKLKMGGW